MFINKFAIVIVLLLLVGCASPQRRAYFEPADYVPIDEVVIQKKFNVINLTHENLLFEMNRCIHQLSVSSKKTVNIFQAFPTKNLHVLSHQSSGNMFMVKGIVGICLQQSSEKFPIFAAEAFYETINPIGVPPDVANVWYSQLGLLIARKGVAKIAYSYASGNAVIVNYWVENAPKSTLFYSSEFKKAGQWESENLDAKFAYPKMTTVVETKRGKSLEKSYVLDHRK